MAAQVGASWKYGRCENAEAIQCISPLSVCAFMCSHICVARRAGTGRTTVQRLWQCLQGTKDSKRCKYTHTYFLSTWHRVGQHWLLDTTHCLVSLSVALRPYFRQNFGQITSGSLPASERYCTDADCLIVGQLNLTMANISMKNAGHTHLLFPAFLRS